MLPAHQFCALARPLRIEYPGALFHLLAKTADAYLSNASTMKELAEVFGVHHTTVNRAVRKVGRARGAGWAPI